MYTELRGCVPKLPIAYCKTIVNRAWRDVRESNLWSFNLYESAWITPPPINTGTCTTSQGSATVTFDSTAQAAIAAFLMANPYVTLTQMQFRPGTVAGIAGIYNIIAYSAGTATLDRIFADPGLTGAAYTIYQNYYVPPYQDHLAWISVRNMSMFLDMILTVTREQIDELDPQRSWYQFPTHVIPFEQDRRGFGTVNASPTIGYMMFELWGIPYNPFTYTCYGLRRGVDLVNPTDTLSFAPGTSEGEEMIMARARYYAYEWAEANKDQAPRNQGPDFRFLMGEANNLYGKLLTRYRKQDKELVNNWFSVRRPGYASKAFGYYNTLASVAGPYTQI